MTNVIFIQDVAGERDWLSDRFPGCVNHQTQSATKWNLADIHKAGSNDIFEVSWMDPWNHSGPLQDSCNMIKSFFSKEYELAVDDNHNWALTDSFVSTSQYLPFQNRDNQFYIALHIARSGTVFVESLLQKRYAKIRNHIGIAADKNQNVCVLDFINTHRHNLTVALIHSSDLWRNLTSTVISNTHGYYHYNDDIDWSARAPVEIGENDFNHHIDLMMYTWNFWCNVRSIFPDVDFYFLDGATMFDRYNAFTTHRAINYDKTRLIKNYHEAKKEFENRYQQDWHNKLQKIKQHLTSMHCKTSLDNIFPK